MKHYIKYLKYILEHKKNVFKVCWEKKMHVHAFTHDMSKFRSIEFKAYANWFHGKYGVKCKDKDNENYVQNQMAKTRFGVAWQHHKDHNKHYWNYWSERELEMPYKYIRQMIIDWTAMSMKFGDTPQEFYLKNYNKIKLENSSRILLEFDLGLNDSMTNNYGHTLKQFYEMDREMYFGNRYFGWIGEKYKVDIDKCIGGNN